MDAYYHQAPLDAIELLLPAIEFLVRKQLSVPVLLPAQPHILQAGTPLAQQLRPYRGRLGSGTAPEQHRLAHTGACRVHHAV